MERDLFSDQVRRKYRQMLFSCAKEDLAPLSGVILQNETLYQKTDDGRGFIDVVKSLGIIPGITVDKGWVGLAGAPGEVFTQGLDDLDARAKEYKSLGCQFTKWRMVVTIGPDMPSPRAVEEGARELALYANICQRNGYEDHVTMTVKLLQHLQGIIIQTCSHH